MACYAYVLLIICRHFQHAVCMMCAVMTSNSMLLLWDLKMLQLLYKICIQSILYLRFLVEINLCSLSHFCSKVTENLEFIIFGVEHLPSEMFCLHYIMQL
ncbi:hypothetical protein PRUPE_8G117600 [Prunus persica]|uniref:Uncharacterized protein n=1 Tax=Prunus persica TaxID=3760 RepID=M5VK67_PRUPE|nr:hypothetical protein PRUPE_8G117600 [Prunus persica]